MQALETDRLILELLTESHAARMFKGLSDPRIYTYISDIPPQSVSTLGTRYKRLSTRKSNDGQEDAWLNWIIRPRDTESLVGYVQATMLEQSRASIAYVLFYDFWGQGFANEAVGAMIRYLLKDRGVTEIIADVDIRNERSINLLAKCGFKQIRILEPREDSSKEIVDAEFSLRFD